MLIFTSICANYVHKARTLAASVKAQLPDATFVLCLLENAVDSRIPAPYFDRIVLAKDAWEGNFERFIFKHTIVEASTAVKGQFLRFLYEEYQDETEFIYLDPDCYVYGDFSELQKALLEHPIVLCPHLLRPGNLDMELSSTAHGVYNLGFLAIHRHTEAKRLMDWWAERLYLYCYDDIGRGIFTDQRWMDLAPCFFDVLVFKHHGYDFAPWALLGAQIEKDGTQYYIDGDPLKFLHFSGFKAVTQYCMKQWMQSGAMLFQELFDEYERLHDANDVDKMSLTEWSYRRYDSGELIDDSIRQRYRDNWDVMFMQENPFAMSNAYFAKALSTEREMKRSALVRKTMTAFRVLREHGVKAVLSVARAKLKRHS